MRLKRLIAHGFKSFADRTEFQFDGAGVSCIVGPNGCGKSNVIDAVKWVLGEQRPTSLRGKEMSDVIFNGTVRRPPMGLCEASLIFDNTSRTLEMDEDEVTVTRKVYRSGETEYQINGKSVRLKDVRDLFAGTGLGPGGYAFMEQGKIDSVLASNPVDRRKVFEEAAGISRFRARKHECTLKLKRVEDNLTRLRDVTEEITRQIRSLKIHAGKARRHREISAKIRELQLAFNLHRYRKILRDQEKVRSRLDDLEGERSRLGDARETLRERLQAVEGELNEAQEATTRARTRHAEVTGRLETCREKLAFQANYLGEVEERLAQSSREIGELEAQVAALEEERVVALREHENLSTDRERAHEVRTRQEAAVTELRERQRELERERDAATEALATVEKGLQEVARDEARLEAEITHLEHRIANATKRRAHLEKEREDLAARIAERSGHQDSQTSVLEEQRVRLTDEERRAEELDHGYVAQAEALRELEGARQRHQTRLDLLEGLIARREGLDDGVKALLQQRESDREFLGGFRGLLLDLFDVDLEHARAVQVALGAAAEAVVVDTVADALEGVRFLESQGLGDAIFLPLERFAEVPLASLNGIRPQSEAVGRVLSALVGGIEVVGKEELERSLETPGEARPVLVTPEGELLKSGRVLSLPRAGRAGEGLVVLHAEMKKIQGELPKLVERCDLARAQMEATRAARDAARVQVKEFSVSLLKEEGEAARLDQEIVRMVREVERLAHESDGLFEEERAGKENLSQARERATLLVAARERLTEERTAAEETTATRRAALAEHLEVIEGAARELETARIDEAKVVERLEAVAARRNQLTRSLEETVRRLEQSRKETEDLEKSRADSRALIATETQNQESLAEEFQNGDRILKEREEASRAVRERQTKVVTELEGVEEGLAEIADSMGGQRGKEGALQAAMDGLLERTQEDLDVDLVAYAATQPDEEPRVDHLLAEAALSEPEEAEDGAANDAEPAEATEAPEGEAAPAEENAADTEAAPAVAEAEARAQTAADSQAEAAVEAPAPRVSPTNWKAVERELKALRERLVRLGNVNLAAVEELEEAEERASFILNEQKDLEVSRDELHRILKSIEEQSTKMFLTTFDAVREHFLVIFRQLFGGGKADIILEDHENPLESGIEIKARPPGKQLRSISLLSGGERTMTAVALLFAIFRAHPAPCALMDEVDAALDEDNTERFCHMLDGFIQQSQFVIVTHSKRTMERADVLYGVTMPERGVSRHVAVRLEQVGEDGQIRDEGAGSQAPAAKRAPKKAAKEQPREPDLEASAAVAEAD